VATISGRRGKRKATIMEKRTHDGCRQPVWRKKGKIAFLLRHGRGGERGKKKGVRLKGFAYGRAAHTIQREKRKKERGLANCERGKKEKGEVLPLSFEDI